MEENDILGLRFDKMSRDEIKAWQDERLPIQVKQAAKSPWYAAKFKELGINPEDIKCADDITKLPFTTKDDLRASYPTGMLSVDPSEIVRMHTSSGTTGKPTAIMHTKQDVENWSEIMGRSLYACGFRKEDVFQNMSGYGLFSGGLGIHMAAEKLGMWTIPAGTGNTERQLMLIRDFNVTGVHVTPSYFMHVAETMIAKGEDPSELPIKRAISGAEPYTEEFRQKLESLYGIKVYNNYGLSEMNGPGVGIECEEQAGMHIWEDSYIVELIDPKTLEPVKEGEVGELVLTLLRRTGMPILRYRTKDLTRIIPGKCACGREHIRIERFVGRSDDMLIVSGVNCFPSQIEEVIMKHTWLGGNYLITLTKENFLDRMTIEVEMNKNAFEGHIDKIRKQQEVLANEIKAQLGFNIRLHLVEQGSLPVSVGKAKRVIDKRGEL